MQVDRQRCFTQQDPIGLAGGLNLYGFASGDPVNFSDPFGLCPPCWAAFEIASTAFDVGDLAVTAVGYSRGRASGAQLAVTASGTLFGLVAVGGGYGAAARQGLRGARTWGRAETLGDHFARHGGDFGARNADEYADMASDFFRRSQADGLPTKVDADGVIRVYDPASNTFGAFNPDGTTRTFFKPGAGGAYWDRQPGAAPSAVPNKQ